ncbi:hypothetical protein [Gemmatimonas sp.]
MADEAETTKRTVPIDYGFSVYRNADNEITIEQPDPFGRGDSLVSVSVERLPLLLKYLHEVRDEILADQAPAQDDGLRLHP